MKDFQRLAASSEADGHLQQKLKQLLKLSKEKWDAACDHSKSAVQVRCRTAHIIVLDLEWVKLGGSALACGVRCCS